MLVRQTWFSKKLTSYKIQSTVWLMLERVRAALLSMIKLIPVSIEKLLEVVREFRLALD